MRYLVEGQSLNLVNMHRHKESKVGNRNSVTSDELGVVQLVVEHIRQLQQVASSEG